MILAIPGTSVPSERVFSKAGKIVSKFRTSLQSENVNYLIFLKSNKNHRINLCENEKEKK